MQPPSPCYSSIPHPHPRAQARALWLVGACGQDLPYADWCSAYKLVVAHMAAKDVVVRACVCVNLCMSVCVCACVCGLYCTQWVVAT